MYERAGAPSPSDSRLAPGRRPLPRTTAWRIVERKKLPPTAEQLVTFLTLCGIGPDAQRPYIDAYHRITTHRTRPEPPSARRPPDHLARLVRLGLDELASARPVPDHLVRDELPLDIDTFNLPHPYPRFLQKLPRDEITTAVAVATAFLASREARRNGSTFDRALRVENPSSGPSEISIMPLAGGRSAGELYAIKYSPLPDTFRDDKTDLITRNADGSTTIYEAKSHHRPTPPPPPARDAGHAA
ncbi:hypothetical protein [Streptomyces sp. NBC_01716]|uniref:hypothetical protein n=1 Tax=Streptomyces sp. NBC_01716 TaxID=2975917 RepID=UPI002E376BB8|nr:hypothetical protein [Streptomyces sp. NBC_01716]